MLSRLILKILTSNKVYAINCSHIGHIDISKCLCCWDVQSVTVSDLYVRQILKVLTLIKSHAINCSHIWHIEISKYVCCSDAYFVNFLGRYVTRSNCNARYRQMNSQKTHLKQSHAITADTSGISICQNERIY